jgi:hypothetical protein
MARTTETMALATATDTSSMAKAILSKIMDSKTIGKEVVNSSRMDMEDQMVLTRTDTRKPTTRRIDNMTNEANSDQAEEDMRNNPMDVHMQEMAIPVDSITMLACKIGHMILATSNGQREVDLHHRIVQDHKGRQIRIIEVDQDLMHSSYRQIRTIEVNHLSPEALIREMALPSHGRVTKAKKRNEINMIREMTQGSKKLLEIGQINGHLRRNRMVDPTRSSHRHRTPRRVQWRSGKQRRRPECMKPLTSQK